VELCGKSVSIITLSTPMKSRSCRPTGSELQELVMHFSVYCGWLLGRQLDDVLVEVADELGVVT
jgi:hypothetical protein